MEPNDSTESENELSEAEHENTVNINDGVHSETALSKKASFLGDLRDSSISSSTTASHSLSPNSPRSSASPTSSNYACPAENEMALHGVSMVINDEWTEAEELFAKYKDQSAAVSAGSCILLIFKALTSFDEHIVKEALKRVDETEKLCKPLLSSITKLLKRKKHKPKHSEVTVEREFERRILSADCLVYRSILIIFASPNVDVRTYMRAGWNMRSAWRLYDHTLSHLNGSPALSAEVCSRLIATASFGSGMLNLGVSLVPPAMARIIRLIGIDADRRKGLMLLERAIHAEHMNAPLAVLVLLWYHVAVRTIFAVDAKSIERGMKKATQLLEGCAETYSEASIFLFFQAKIQRLRGELSDALSTFKEAVVNSIEQRELQHLCTHEIGWIHMMRLQWPAAVTILYRLKSTSRWTKNFYMYLTGLCQGAYGKTRTALATLKDIPPSTNPKSHLEAFVTKRVPRLLIGELTSQHMAMYALEAIYLWNTPPQFSTEHLQKMLDICSGLGLRTLYHLRCLIEGAIYSMMSNYTVASQCFYKAMSSQELLGKADLHVLAFSLFELARIAIFTETDDTDEAKAFLLRAKALKGYDGEHRLRIQIPIALKRLQSAEEHSRCSSITLCRLHRE